MLAENKIVASKFDKFKQSRFPDKEDGYIVDEYKNGFKSYKVPEESFTNFIENKNTLKSFKILELLKYLRTNKNLSMDLFDGTDIQLDNCHKLTRRINILNKSGLCDLATSNIQNVRKYKYLKETGIQLYFWKNENRLKLIAVDTYHLITPTEKQDYKKEYGNYKDYKFNIKKLFYIKMRLHK